MTATPNSSHAKPSRGRGLIIALCILLAIAVAVTATLLILKAVGEQRLRQDLVRDELIQAEGDFDETAIHHNGKAYHYNSELINLLLIGVDRSEGSKDHKQADALYLLSIDPAAKAIRVVNISRNTMCPVNTLDTDGRVYGSEYTQLCLAYAYGSTPDASAKNTVRAVSGLLYDIPISGYYALHLDTVSQLVELVGGVTVTVPTDANAYHLLDKRGKTTRLNGTEAVAFLQYRGDSNGPRTERQQQFIAAYKTAALGQLKRDLTLPVKMLNIINKNSSTNLDLSGMVYLATEALGWPMSFVSVPGTYATDNGPETFTVDEDALKTLIIDNFYTES